MSQEPVEQLGQGFVYKNGFIIVFLHYKKKSIMDSKVMNNTISMVVTGKKTDCSKEELMNMVTHLKKSITELLKKDNKINVILDRKKKLNHSYFRENKEEFRHYSEELFVIGHDRSICEDEIEFIENLIAKK